MSDPLGWKWISRQIRGVLTASLFFLYFGCLSFNELEYALQGRITTALVTQTHAYVTSGKSGPHHWLAIEYQFWDPSGQQRVERDDVPLPDSPPLPNTIVNVEYRPGIGGASRISGNDHKLEAVVFLIVCTAALLIYSLIQARRNPVEPIVRLHPPGPESSGMFDGLAR